MKKIPAGRWCLWFRQVPLGAVVRRIRPVLTIAAWVWRRLLFRTTFIAITGSVGKTTATECLATLLAGHDRTFRTYRNQNAGYLLMLNVLRVRPWHRYAVLEVAGAFPGALPRIARLLRPDIAIVLSVVRTHTAEFVDLDQHAAEKAHLVAQLADDGTAVINVDDPRVAAIAPPPGRRLLSVGVDPSAALRASAVRSAWPGRLRFEVSHAGESYPVETQLVGRHWTPTVLGVLGGAVAAGIPLAAAARAVRAFEPFPGRLQPIRLPSGAIVLRDDYNCSVDVLEAALRVLEDAVAERRVIVLTDVSDFGGNSRQRRKHLAPAIARSADAAVLIGENAAYGGRRLVEAGMPPASVFACRTLREAAQLLRAELRAGDLVLLKGRTTDHVARLFWAHFGPVGCWKDYCEKRMLCDICWELDVAPAIVRSVRAVPADPLSLLSAPSSPSAPSR